MERNAIGLFSRTVSKMYLDGIMNITIKDQLGLPASKDRRIRCRCAKFGVFSATE
jgi:hypothetical protein